VFWAVVRDFLDALPVGSLVADVGCGDGKYFGVTNENNLVMVGCDRSMGLLKALKDGERAANKAILEGGDNIAVATAAGAGVGEAPSKPTHNQTFCCDAVQVPMRTDAFDATLCIAVLHHLGTVDRRISVIRELVRITRPGGCVLIQAWAYEQEANSRHQFKPPTPAPEAEGVREAGTGKRGAGGDSAADQDVLVAWRLTKCWAQPGQKPTEGSAESVATSASSVAAGETTSASAAGTAPAGQAVDEAAAKAARYAALNAAKERKREKKLSKKARAAAVVEKEASERAEKEKNGDGKTVPVLRVADMLASAAGVEGSVVASEVEESERHFVYQRYCHVYRRGELEDLCSSVPGVRIAQSGYDKNNWYIMLQKLDPASMNDESGAVAGVGLAHGRSSAVPTPLDRVRTTMA
jgi:SAM-dependent methyltransferase